MKVFFVDYKLNGQDMSAVIEGETPGQVQVQLLKHYMEQLGMILFVREITELMEPIFFINGKGVKV